MAPVSLDRQGRNPHNSGIVISFVDEAGGKSDDLVKQVEKIFSVDGILSKSSNL